MSFMFFLGEMYGVTVTNQSIVLLWTATCLMSEPVGRYSKIVEKDHILSNLIKEVDMKNDADIRNYL